MRYGWLCLPVMDSMTVYLLCSTAVLSDVSGGEILPGAGILLCLGPLSREGFIQFISFKQTSLLVAPVGQLFSFYKIMLGDSIVNILIVNEFEPSLQSVYLLSTVQVS